MFNGARVSCTILKYLKLTHIESLFNNESKRLLCNQLQVSNSDMSVIDCDLETKIDWNKEIEIMKAESKSKSVLQETTENFSDISKSASPTFNFGPFVNKSEVLKNMIKLRVDLSKVEKKYGGLESVLKLDFEKDVKGHIFFLSDYVDPNSLGSFLTENMSIFHHSLQDLQTRINYLESKRFTKDMISRIVTLNPYWLNFSTKRIDRRLGHFQKTFDLNGNEVRSLTTKQPRLITYNMHDITVNTFAIKEEMGFEDEEVKKLLLTKPRLWMMSQTSLLERFEYIHKQMKISHAMICQMPQILLCREFKLKQRHSFLQKLGRDQFDCTKPNYISLIKLVEGSDTDFCFNIAKCSISDYNIYLKSL